jgi:hypothetical protein
MARVEEISKYLTVNVKNSDNEKMLRASLSITFSLEGRGMISVRKSIIGCKRSGGISNKVRSKVNRELE